MGKMESSFEAWSAASGFHVKELLNGARCLRRGAPRAEGRSGSGQRGPGLSCYPGAGAPNRTCPSNREGPPEWIFRRESTNPAGTPTLISVRPVAAQATLGWPAGSALKVSRQRTTRRSGRGFEDQSQLGATAPAGAHPPPVDQEASRHRDGDLLGPAAIGRAQFLARPRHRAIAGLELE